MRVLVGYVSKDGHTREVAETVGEVMGEMGHMVDVVDVADLPAGFSMKRYEAAVLGAPVRLGKHPKVMRRFASKHRDALEGIPSAFFSCSLVSAHEGEEARRTERELVEGFVNQTGWHPDQIGIFAGALLYRRYNPIMRAVMRAVVRSAGGETDTSRDYDYTRWEDVEAFANEFSRGLFALAESRAAG